MPVGTGAGFEWNQFGLRIMAFSFAKRRYLAAALRRVRCRAASRRRSSIVRDRDLAANFRAIGCKSSIVRGAATLDPPYPDLVLSTKYGEAFCLAIGLWSHHRRRHRAKVRYQFP